MEEKISTCPRCKTELVLEDEDSIITCPTCGELLVSFEGVYIIFEIYLLKVRSDLMKIPYIADIRKVLELDNKQDLRVQAKIRCKLINEMVGTLYPSILKDEVDLIYKRIDKLRKEELNGRLDS